MRLDELEQIHEASYGSNPEKFNDGKIKYNGTKKAFYLVKPVDKGLFLVTILYFNGNVVITTTKDSKVDQLFTGSFAALVRQDNVNKAIQYFDEAMDMLAVMLKKYRNRIPTIRFTVFEATNFKKLEIVLKKPSAKTMLTRYGYEFVEPQENGKALMYVYTTKPEDKDSTEPQN